MERAGRPSTAPRSDVFETQRGARRAGTGFSPAGSAIAPEATATGIALEATATRGFDFMEDRPLDARGRAGNKGNTGARGSPRVDKRTAPGCGGGSGRRVASLLELLQELSSPRAQSSTTSRERTRPLATACPPATNSLPGGTSSSGKTVSTGLCEASGAVDRHEANGETEGTLLRSVSGRENSPGQSSLYGPARPALRREDDPRGFSSKEARRVTFAGTRAASREHATIAAAAPPPTPPATLLDEQRQKSGSSAIIPSRPKRPTGIQGVGSAKGRRSHRDPTQGATKRVALGNVTTGNARGENRALAGLTASAAHSGAPPKMASSAGHAHTTEGESGPEELSAKRRRGYARELHGGSTLVGAAGRSEGRRRDVVGVGRLSGEEPARGRGGGGRVSPAKRAVEQMPRVGAANKQGPPQGGCGVPIGQSSVAVDPWTNQGRTTSMWMWQDEGDLHDSEQQESIESRPQSQVSEVQNARQVRGIRPQIAREERQVEIERQGGGAAATVAATADTGDSALVERRDGGLAKREARNLDNGEEEWSYDTGADDNAGQEEGGKGGPTKELVRVRGLCHMRGAILALVEWSVVDAEGATGTELSFMLSSALKAEWPHQYITFLEERMVFNTEEEANGTRGEARGNPSSVVEEGAGSALEVWKPGEPATSRLPA